MSVYDYSPQAIESYHANISRCKNWAGDTAEHAGEFRAPFGTRSDISSASSKLALEPGEDDGIEIGSMGVPQREMKEMEALLAAQGSHVHPEHRHGHHHHRSSGGERSRKTSTDTERPEHDGERRRRRHGSRSRSRDPHSDSGSKEDKRGRRTRKSSTQTITPSTALVPIQNTYHHPSHAQPTPFIPPPMELQQQPETKRGLFSFLKKRRSTSVPRPAPWEQQQQPQQRPRHKKSSNPVLYYPENPYNDQVSGSSSKSRSKSMDPTRRAAPSTTQGRTPPTSPYYSSDGSSHQLMPINTGTSRGAPAQISPSHSQNPYMHVSPTNQYGAYIYSAPAPMQHQMSGPQPQTMYMVPPQPQRQQPQYTSPQPAYAQPHPSPQHPHHQQLQQQAYMYPQPQAAYAQTSTVQVKRSKSRKSNPSSSTAHSAAVQAQGWQQPMGHPMYQFPSYSPNGRGAF